METGSKVTWTRNPGGDFEVVLVGTLGEYVGLSGYWVHNVKQKGVGDKRFKKAIDAIVNADRLSPA